METISLNQFIEGISNLENNNSLEEKTNIRCPKCDELVYKLNNIIFTSYPPKHKYICKNYGWSNFA